MQLCTTMALLVGASWTRRLVHQLVYPVSWSLLMSLIMSINFSYKMHLLCLTTVRVNSLIATLGQTSTLEFLFIFFLKL